MAFLHRHADDPYARGSAGFAAPPDQTSFERWITLIVAAGLIFGLVIFPMTCVATNTADAETSAERSR
ncbi:MAG: hypothetical protein AAGK78_02400 [Planctomycetota bacterium]